MRKDRCTELIKDKFIQYKRSHSYETAIYLTAENLQKTLIVDILTAVAIVERIIHKESRL